MAVIEADSFSRRFKVLYKCLNNEKVDGIFIVYGKDSGAYTKSMAMHQWLFGITLINTAIVIHGKTITLLGNKKVYSFLEPIKKDCTFDFIERSKNDDEREGVENFISKIKSLENIKSIGYMPKDKFEGKFYEMVKEKIEKLPTAVDVSPSLAVILSIKDEDEIKKIKVASNSTVDVYKKELRGTILDILDKGDRVPHVDIANKTETYVSKIAKGDLESLEICYPPIIQSGGKFNLKFSIESDTNNLHSGVIICSMGLRYDYYCSNIIRTLMVNASPRQKELYEYISSKLYQYAVEQIKPGKTFSEVAHSIEKKVNNEKPELSDNFLTQFGFSTGTEFKDRYVTITKNCNVLIKKNMVLIFYLGLQNLENKNATDKKSKVYSIWIGDTILVHGADGTNSSENQDTEIGGNLILTGAAKKRNKDNLFKLSEDNDEEMNNAKPLVDLENYGRGQRRVGDKIAKQEDETTEAKRKEHQTDLFRKLLVESEKRLLGIKTTDETVTKKKNYTSYKSFKSLPKDESIYNSHVFIDKRSHSVLSYPLGYWFPLHLSIIKNASHTEEGDKSFLRFILHPKGGNVLGKTVSDDEDPEEFYLKEITIKTSNIKLADSHFNFGSYLNNVAMTFKEELRRYKQQESQAQEHADLVVQDTLKLNNKREVPKLKDLYIRPTISKQRITGNLECHENGFRFVSMKADNIDILFNNIKHAFFQPCDKEMIVLIHFHLRNPIMHCKKKQKDIQFYTEVGELITDLGKMNHMHDRDDLESEQREMEMRRKINDAFMRFCNRVNEINDRIDFDQPIRNLGFMGCPGRSTVLLQPTTACLVQLTEWPPFVVTMDEVELIFFERVNLSNKSFDMVIIFKDYNEKPVTVCSLPQEKLDDVKNWLDHIDVYYAEGGKSLNWLKIMKNIVEDPQQFISDGGWGALCGDSDGDEEEDEDMEEDEVYNPSESGGEEEEEESDSEAGDGEESDWSGEDSESGEAELSSDEEEGLDWDDLEEEARKEDAIKEREVEEPPRKKKKHR